MVTFYAISLILVLLFIIYKRLNNNYQEEKFRYKMHRLRDNLRKLAIDGHVNSKSQEFDYLDFSISKEIEAGYFLTITYLIMIFLKHKNRSDLDSYKIKWEKVVLKINSNPALKEISDEKTRITLDYLMGQNKLILLVGRNCLHMIYEFSSIKNKSYDNNHSSRSKTENPRIGKWNNLLCPLYKEGW